MADPAFNLHALMHEVSHPFGFLPVIEPDLSIGIPAAVENPAAHILGKARDGIGIEGRTALLEVPDFALEGLAQSFVGVERKNPVMLGVLGGAILLVGVTAPGIFDDLGAEIGSQLDGSV